MKFVFPQIVTLGVGTTFNSDSTCLSIEHRISKSHFGLLYVQSISSIWLFFFIHLVSMWSFVVFVSSSVGIQNKKDETRISWQAITLCFLSIS